MTWPMLRILAPIALLAAPMTVLAQAAPPPPSAAVLDIDQRLLLRCAATFALVADRQQRGEEWAQAFPALAERGRQFFVVASAQVMADTRIDSAALQALLTAEAEQLVAYDQARHMMPVCLPLLEEAGL